MYEIFGLRQQVRSCPEQICGLLKSQSLTAFSCSHGEDAAPPRVIVFAETEDQAVKLATPLRNSLWGVHRLAVLLPHGEEPLQVQTSDSEIRLPIWPCSVPVPSDACKTLPPLGSSGAHCRWWSSLDCLRFGLRQPVILPINGLEATRAFLTSMITQHSKAAALIQSQGGDRK